MTCVRAWMVGVAVPAFPCVARPTREGLKGAAGRCQKRVALPPARLCMALNAQGKSTSVVHRVQGAPLVPCARQTGHVRHVAPSMRACAHARMPFQLTFSPISRSASVSWSCSSLSLETFFFFPMAQSGPKAQRQGQMWTQNRRWRGPAAAPIRACMSLRVLPAWFGVARDDGPSMINFS
jgi:hypothetical protein